MLCRARNLRPRLSPPNQTSLLLLLHRFHLLNPKPSSPLPPHKPPLIQNPNTLLLHLRRHLSSQPQPPPPPPAPKEEASSLLPVSSLCPGCGIQMQASDPSLPGFFSLPSPKPPDYHARLHRPIACDDSHLSLSLKSGHLQEPQEQEEQETTKEKVVVCARCHSLRHYGRVKHPGAEHLLPDFDFVAAVGPRLASTSGARSLVLLLADAADFDGSFPRAVARLVASAGAAHHADWKRGAPANLPRALLVLTKLDLLPTPSLSPNDVQALARTGDRRRMAVGH